MTLKLTNLIIFSLINDLESRPFDPLVELTLNKQGGIMLRIIMIN